MIRVTGVTGSVFGFFSRKVWLSCGMEPLNQIINGMLRYLEAAQPWLFPTRKYRFFLQSLRGSFYYPKVIEFQASGKTPKGS
jgi:hypothetical protein